MPSHSSVEEYARTILAELELLAVAAPENTSKRQRIALVNADQSKGKASGKQGGTAKGSEASGGDGKGNTQVKKPCTGWITDKDCRLGKSCTFAGKCLGLRWEPSEVGVYGSWWWKASEASGYRDPIEE